MRLLRIPLQLVCLVALVLGAMLSSPSSADNSIDRHLARAEAVKRSQQVEFDAELEAVEAERSLLSPRQQEHLEYLRTWQHAYAGEFDAAIKGFQALIANGSDPLLRFRSRVTMLNSLTQTRRYAESYEQLNLLLAQLETVTDADARSQALGATAQLLNLVAQYDESLRYSTRMLEENSQPWSRCGAAQLRYESLVRSGKLKDVDAELLRWAEDCANRGEHVFAGLIRTFIAQLQMQNGRHAEAIAGLLSHQTTVRATSYPYLIADVAAKLATAYLAQGNYQQAAVAAQEVIDHTAADAYTESLAEAWRVNYQIAQRQGDDLRALRSLEQYQKVDRAYLDDVRKRALAFEMARHQSRAKAIEIDNLNQKNQLLNLQKEATNQSLQGGRLLTLLLITILVIAVLWLLRVRAMNRHFRDLAQRDALTTVASRAHFMEQSAQLLEQLRPTQEPAAVVVMDLDQFKHINDCYGHAVGDDALHRAAVACRNALGSDGLIGRLGGEEFAMLLPRQSTRAAAEFAERCRAALQKIRFGPADEAHLLSGSFGIAGTQGSGYDLERLLADGDAAMYEAKQQGRNRVVTRLAVPTVA